MRQSNRICYAIICVCLVISGCATQTKVVATPIPAPPNVERPDLEVFRLKAGDSPDVVVKAYRMTILQLQSYSKQLETILYGYRPK